MYPNRLRFSHRRQSQIPKEDLLPDELPIQLREAIAAAAIYCSYNIVRTKELIRKTVLYLPRTYDWENGSVEDEIKALITECEWYLVFDVVEVIYADLIKKSPSSGITGAMLSFSKSMQPGKGAEFRELVNERLMVSGSVWKLSKVGGIVKKSDIQTYDLLSSISEKMEDSNPTALSEISKALDDLNRKPEPDYSGSVHHSMAALECLVIERFGRGKDAQMSDVIRRINFGKESAFWTAVEKLFVSSHALGRHVKEGKPPSPAQARFIAHTASAMIALINDLDDPTKTV